MITRLNKNQCPYCESELDAVAPIGAEDDPDEGSITICAYCFNLLIFGEGFAVKKITHDEWTALGEGYQNWIKKARNDIIEADKMRRKGMKNEDLIATMKKASEGIKKVLPEKADGGLLPFSLYIALDGKLGVFSNMDHKIHEKIQTALVEYLYPPKEEPIAEKVDSFAFHIKEGWDKSAKTTVAAEIAIESNKPIFLVIERGLSIPEIFKDVKCTVSYLEKGEDADEKLKKMVAPTVIKDRPPEEIPIKLIEKTSRLAEELRKLAMKPGDIVFFGEKLNEEEKGLVLAALGFIIAMDPREQADTTKDLVKFLDKIAK